MTAAALVLAIAVAVAVAALAPGAHATEDDPYNCSVSRVWLAQCSIFLADVDGDGALDYAEIELYINRICNRLEKFLGARPELILAHCDQPDPVTGEKDGRLTYAEMSSGKSCWSDCYKRSLAKMHMSECSALTEVTMDPGLLRRVQGDAFNGLNPRYRLRQLHDRMRDAAATQVTNLRASPLSPPRGPPAA
jgi:hypothetical protein